MDILQLKKEVVNREEENLPYLFTKVKGVISNHPENKDKFRAITGVVKDGSLFSGNLILLEGEYEGVYINPQPENTYHKLSRY